MKNVTQLTGELIARDFGLDLGEEELSEKELFDLLSDAVAYMIEHRLDFLLSLLYRLDVEESKINFALSPRSIEPANVALAQLIFDRQKQRIFTKQKYKQTKPEDFEGMEF